MARKKKRNEGGTVKKKIIKKSNPLFGIIIEGNQVGIDPATGREGPSNP